MMKRPKDEPNYREWLEGAGEAGPPDFLTEALDSLYATGPSDKEQAHARKRVYQALIAAKPSEVFYDQIPQSPVGSLFLAISDLGVLAIDFSDTEDAFLKRLHKRIGKDPVRSSERVANAVKQVVEYLAGERNAFELELDLSHTTSFQRQVLQMVRQVPRGQVTTYGELARRIGKPKGARAVGRALGSNPIPIIIPCHRVLAFDGSLGGYSGRGGVKTKAQLLRLEGALV